MYFLKVFKQKQLKKLTILEKSTTNMSSQMAEQVPRRRETFSLSDLPPRKRPKLSIISQLNYVSDTEHLSNNSWKLSDEDLDENVYPPFDDWGETLIYARKSAIEDTTEIHRIYERAFNIWTGQLMRKLCDMISFILQEQNVSERNNKKFIHENNGKTLATYMTACCYSQKLANITRDLIFPYFRKSFFSRERTLQKKLKEMIDWNKGFNGLVNKRKIWHCNLRADYAPKQVKPSSKNYMWNGTVMHENVGLQVTVDLMYVNGYGGKDVFIPGRIVSIKLPFLASTPDICVCANKNKLEDVYADVVQNKRVSEKLKIYVPLVWGEIKTLQSENAIIHKKQLEKLLMLTAQFDIHNTGKKGGSISEILTIDDWDDVFCFKDENYKNDLIINDLKEEIVYLLSECFKNNGWMTPYNNQMSSKKILDLLLKRNSNIVESSVADKCKNVFVPQERLKHLFSSQMDKIKNVEIAPLVEAGHAWVLFYGKRGRNDKCIQQVFFEKAPFILGPCSNFYVQMIEQACCVQYMNGKAKYLFIAITKHASEQNEDESDINHPCLVYAYEVIIPDCVRSQYEKQCFFMANEHFGFETPVIDAGQKVIDNLMWNDNDYDNCIPCVNMPSKFKFFLKN